MTVQESGSEWAEVTFGDLVAHFIDFRGRTPKKLGMDWGDGDIPALSANNVTMGRVDLAKECHLGSDDLYRRWMTSGDANKGDVLLTMEAPLGNVAQVPDDRKYILSQRVVLIKPKRDLVLADFLKQFMLSDGFQTLLRQHATGTTATGIQRARLVTLPTKIPPLGEQKKIAAILSSVDEAIEATQAVIDQLQVVKKAMMAELLTRGLPGSHTRLKQTVIGEVPEAWDAVPLGSLLASIDAGWSPLCDSVPANEDEWGVLKVSAVSWGEFRPHENKRLPAHLEARPQAEVRSGDLLVSRANTPELVGRCVLVRQTRPKLMLSDKLMRLRVNQAKASAGFLRLVMETPRSRQQIEDGATGSSRSMKNISQEKLRSILVPQPTLPEQIGIARSFDLIGERTISEESMLEGLRTLKAALMSVLLTGEVRVKPDEGTS